MRSGGIKYSKRNYKQSSKTQEEIIATHDKIAKTKALLEAAEKTAKTEEKLKLSIKIYRQCKPILGSWKKRHKTYG